MGVWQSGPMGGCLYEPDRNGHVTVPNGVERVEDGAFRSCTALVSITLPDNLISLGDYAFYGCSSLVSITLPDTVTSFGHWSFAGCSALASIRLPPSLSIGRAAFGSYGCRATVIAKPHEMRLTCSSPAPPPLIAIIDPPLPPPPAPSAPAPPFAPENCQCSSDDNCTSGGISVAGRCGCADHFDSESYFSGSESMAESYFCYVLYPSLCAPHHGLAWGLAVLKPLRPLHTKRRADYTPQSRLCEAAAAVAAHASACPSCR